MQVQGKPFILPPSPSARGRSYEPPRPLLLPLDGGGKGQLQNGLREAGDFGYNIVRDPVPIHDLHATILHLLGMDPYKLSYAHQGLNERLIGPTDEPDVMKGILA